jgi:hypothetical protein
MESEFHPACVEVAAMRSLGGFIALIVVALIGGLIYKYSLSSVQSTAAATPFQTIDGVGARNDLLSIAQAERAYQAEHGKYASMDDLISSGEMSMRKTRQGYTYDVDTSDEGFRATARCTPEAQGCQSYVVDQTMSVQPAP